MIPTVPDPVRRLLLAVALGALGGGTFLALGLPLPWLLGAMLFSTLAALSGVRPEVPNRLRMAMLAVLGVMLGSDFSPGLLARVGDWGPSLLGLTIVTLLTPFLLMAFFLRFGPTGPVTAYFSAAPGGLSEMVSIGTEKGGDGRTISLVHALRILFVVFTVPIWFQVFGVLDTTGGEVDMARPALAGPSLLAGGMTLKEAAILAACAVIGLPLARLLRIPAAPLIGPMVLSGVAHLTGLAVLRPPVELIALAQIVIGASLGSRFAGSRVRELGRIALVSMAASLVMLLLAAATAWAVAAVTGLPFVTLMLAYVPGGVAEMSLISLALGADVAFVATHHLVRIALVVMAAPLMFKLLPPVPPDP